MTRKTLTAMFGVLALISIVPIAHAEIASSAYVDERDNSLIFGDTPSAASVQSLEANGGILGEMGVLYGNMINTVSKEQFNSNALIVTDGSGKVSTANGGFITDSNISSTAGIQMGKIALPEPPDDCRAAGGSCALMYVAGTGYVWETMARDDGEAAPTSGAVGKEVKGTYNASVQRAIGPNVSPWPQEDTPPADYCNTNAECRSKGYSACVENRCVLAAKRK